MRSECVISNPAPAAALVRAGVRPRKSRGQNFLTQPALANRIVHEARLTAGDAVLEIGPGLGLLTDALLATPISRLILIELDPRLAAALRERVSAEPRATLIEGDFLELDSRETFPAEGGAVVLGNLPFNVASAILERLCAMRAHISRMVLMFQHEVAERIRAEPGSRNYGALSAFTALYWKVTGHFRVAAGSFHPRPKVDAEVLVFERIPRPLFEDAEERAVLETIRASFTAPRKMMRNSFANGLGLPPDQAEALLHAAKIDPSVRPALLATADFVGLARIIYMRHIAGLRDA